MTASSLSTDVPLEGLTLFPDLPLELQVKILKYAMPRPQIFKLQFQPPPHNSNEKAKFSSAMVPSPLLSVCKLSRAEILKIYNVCIESEGSEKKIRLDGAHDILYIQQLGDSAETVLGLLSIWPVETVIIDPYTNEIRRCRPYPPHHAYLVKADNVALVAAQFKSIRKLLILASLYSFDKGEVALGLRLGSGANHDRYFASIENFEKALVSLGPPKEKLKTIEAQRFQYTIFPNQLLKAFRLEQRVKESYETLLYGRGQDGRGLVVATVDAGRKLQPREPRDNGLDAVKRYEDLQKDIDNDFEGVREETVYIVDTMELSAEHHMGYENLRRLGGSKGRKETDPLCL